MLEAAAIFSERHKITRQEQEAYACASHRKAMAADFADELVDLFDLRDDFTRTLGLPVCERLPLLVGAPLYGLTSATVAVEADAAAAVLVLSERVCKRLCPLNVMRVHSFRQVGGLADQPILAGLDAALSAIENLKSEISIMELMESFAAQAIMWAKTLRVDESRLNRGGGALSRGHPIGASGAVLAVRMFHELKREPSDSLGLAVIAAAGGLGSAMLFQKC
jgi:acetyl-CoA C-acetyltransferase